MIWNERIFYELVGCFTPGRRWLDLGCGRGPRSPELLAVRQRMGERMYVGVDFDRDSLAEYKQPNRVRADAAALPFSDGFFDLVTSDMVFEHLANPVDVLKESWRVLNDAGALIVHTASAVHYQLIVGRLLSKVLPQDTYVRLVSHYTGRAPSDIFPTQYASNTARKFSRAAMKANFEGGFVTHLETPFQSGRGIEQCVQRMLPRIFKSTLLAVYFKRHWKPK